MPFRAAEALLPDQAAQNPEVDAVHRPVGAFLLRRFEDHWPSPEAEIVDQQLERLQTEAAAADVGVAIHAAAVRLEAVVDMKSLEPRQTNRPMEVAHRRFVLRCRPETIAGGKDMAGIEAHSQPLGLLHQ